MMTRFLTFRQGKDSHPKRNHYAPLWVLMQSVRVPEQEKGQVFRLTGILTRALILQATKSWIPT
jgi:hypothetical protein